MQKDALKYAFRVILEKDNVIGVGAKVFQNKWNMNVVISGGYGIFNKAALIEVGGYDVKSMGQ